MNSQAAVPQRIKIPAVLQRKLWETNRKLAEVLRQKENLSGTCESRAEYINQLTAQVEALQAQKAWADEEVEQLKVQQGLNSEYQDHIGRLDSDLQKANSAVEELQETLRVQGEEFFRQKALYETEIRGREEQYRHICEQNSRLTVRLEEIQEVRSCLEQVCQRADSLQGRLDEANGRIEALTIRLAEQGESLLAAQEMVRHLQEAGKVRPFQSSGLDVPVGQWQEAVNQFRKRFAFGPGRTQRAGQRPARVEGEPESAQDQGNEPGKVRSLQYQLGILGGQGPGGV